VKTVSDKVVRHSLAYIRAKMIGGGRPFLRENLADANPPPSKTPIFNLFSLVAPQL